MHEQELGTTGCWQRVERARDRSASAHWLASLGVPALSAAMWLAACSSPGAESSSIGTPVTPAGAGRAAATAPSAGTPATAAPVTTPGNGTNPATTPGVGAPAAGGASMLPVTTPPVIGAAGAGSTMTPGEMPAAAGNMAPGPALEGMCPDGFAEPKEGENVNFPHGGVMRQFLVFLPKDMSTPRPVFVALTGTVESTQAFTVTNSGLSELTEKGWIVLAPVRACSTDANDASQSCNGTGTNGWGWRPWNEGSSSPMWRQEVGPDGRFLESMVRCAATKWKLDKTRLFPGGISSGGTFTNRLITFMDDFWAGGVPASGEWYIEGGSGTSGDNTMRANPTSIPTGRCCPQPLKEKLEPMIVITLWGGENDMWMGLSNYRPTTQASSNYFTSKSNIVHVACSGTHGHFWPRMQTGRAFNGWITDLLYSHPKGSDPANFKLTPSPPEFKCQLGRYTDHYDK